MGQMERWAVAAAILCLALVTMTTTSTTTQPASVLDFDSEQALEDLNAGGERVCSYCKYCGLGNLCGRFCVIDLCDFCRFQFHCNTTCSDGTCSE